jgi:uncharacterized protein with NRDE domain
MCLIAFANGVGEHVLVIAANRDEDHARETLPAHFWTDTPDVYGGRDVVAGGTWLGISTRGRVAAITNVRSFPARRGEKSRGALCREFLVSNDRALPYAAAVLRNRAEYGGFNLLVHDGETLCYLSHAIDAPLIVARGVHAVSNAALNDPWPKVERTKRALDKAIVGSGPDVAETLFAMLASREGADDSLLPETGYGLEMERQLAPVFIASQSYGTRSSTVILWRRDGQVTFEERSFGPGGVPIGIERKLLRVRKHTPDNPRPKIS